MQLNFTEITSGGVVNLTKKLHSYTILKTAFVQRKIKLVTLFT